MPGVADIRYSEVASFVGRSLLRDRSSGLQARRPPPPKVGGRSAVLFAAPSSPGSSPSGTRREDRDGGDQLPPIAAEKAARLKTQLSLLQAEQAVQQEQVRKLQHCLSDSIVQERKVKERTARNRELHHHHKRRCEEVEQAIAKLRSELIAMQPLPRGAVESAVDVEAASAATPKPSSGGAASLPRSPMDRHSADTATADTAGSGGPSRLTRRRRSSGGGAHAKGHARRRSSGNGPSTTAAPADSDGGKVAVEVNVIALDDDPAAGEDGVAHDDAADPSEAAERSRVSFDVAEDDEALGIRSEHSDSDSDDATTEDGPRVHTHTAPPPLALNAPKLPKKHTKSMRSAASAPSLAVATVPSDSEEEETPDGFFEEVGKTEAELSKSERAELARIRREVIRAKLIAKEGTARQAFRRLDLNGNGSISHQEFCNGLESLGIPWSQLTRLKNERELFRLFDEDHDHVIIFRELFPEEYKKERDGMTRVPTPEFARRYEREENQSIRAAAWRPEEPEEKIKILQECAQTQEDGVRKKKWMQATMRRLKGKGKSDARCRELVAKHLPRGTGPRDRDGVHMFSSMDLRSVRQDYTDHWNTPLREATKTMQDLRELRREQRQMINRLYQVTEMEQARAQRAEKAATGLSLALFGDRRPAVGSGQAAQSGQDAQTRASADQVRPLLSPDMMSRAPKTVGMISQDTGIPEAQLQDIQGEFLKYSETNSKLANKNFPRLLRALAPTRTLVESDLKAWWEQVIKDARAQQGDDLASPRGLGSFQLKAFGSLGGDDAEMRRAQCDFEQFAQWYASSELRARPTSSGRDG
mmetsp:Transcript_11393/g.32612  ORF Transcript_11393/g.32612 Transcript_11393/m.32612 type:complete len:816 (+) Transcript_11393:65-2512(+)